MQKAELRLHPSRAHGDPSRPPGPSKEGLLRSVLGTELDVVNVFVLLVIVVLSWALVEGIY